MLDELDELRHAIKSGDWEDVSGWAIPASGQ